MLWKKERSVEDCLATDQLWKCKMLLREITKMAISFFWGQFFSGRFCWFCYLLGWFGPLDNYQGRGTWFVLLHLFINTPYNTVYHTHIQKSYNVRVHLRYFGAILVHPMKRQNFANKLHLHLYSIWDCVVSSSCSCAILRLWWLFEEQRFFFLSFFITLFLYLKIMQHIVKQDYREISKTDV